MNILFVTAHTYLPQLYGGLQQSTNALITALKERGHHSAVLCALSPDGLFGKVSRVKIKLSEAKVSKDMGRGYPVYRAWFPWETVAAVVRQENPDVIVVLARMPVKMAMAARQTGVPIIMMLQDVEFNEHGDDFTKLGNVLCAANSAFTAGKYGDAFGVKPEVIHPLIFPEKYITETSREFVTFINPFPSKGLDIALGVAKACPDIPFLFQESWTLGREQLSELKEQIARLPNVTFQHAVSDMRQVYKRTKILLTPSKWEEAYGRVASEVQMSGIPVVASNIGGLPEAVGKGGVLLNPNIIDGDMTAWVSAIQKLWTDNAYYQEMVRESLAHVSRPALNVSSQLMAWEKLLHSVSGKA